MGKIRKWERGGPAWLWDACALAVKCGRDGVDYSAMFDTPPGFANHLEWYKVYTEAFLPEPVMARTWPDHYNATTLYMERQPGAERWFVEAYAMAGMGYKEIAKLMDEDSAGIRLYLEMFFDLSRAPKSKAWMAKYIWEPARARDGRLFIYDFILKGAAAYGGVQALEAVTEPGLVDDKVERWMLSAVEKERKAWALTAAVPNGRVPYETTLPTAARVVESWSEVAKSGSGGSAGLGKIIEAVTSTMRMLTPADEARGGREDILVGTY